MSTLLASRTPEAASALPVAGLSRFSASDWPGHLAATVFTQGCPWDCLYCHNPSLIDRHVPGTLPWHDVVRFAQTRRGMLDGFVFSGGEPTLHACLPEAMTQIHRLGFSVGLHTSGAVPVRLSAALAAADWVGLDIKADAAHYVRVTGRAGSGTHAWRALKLVLDAVRDRADTSRPLGYEVRTTVHPRLIRGTALHELGELLAAHGVDSWAIQRVRTVGMRPQAQSMLWNDDTDEIARVAAALTPQFRSLVVR